MSARDKAGRRSAFRIHAFRDVVEKRPSSGNNFDALDGIRGLAVLLVIASHSGAFGMKGHGSVGVWLFFTLSAFLLTLPFIEDPTRARRLGPLIHYSSRRFLRILPIYYTVILAAFFFQTTSLRFLWEHLLFMRGDGIWWTIPQEMLFYVLLPPLVALLNFLFFRSPFASALKLCVLALVVNYGLTPKVLPMNGNGTVLPFYLGPFLAGMAACYAFHIPQLYSWMRRPGVNRVLGALGIALLALLFLTAPHHQEMVTSQLPSFGTHRSNLGWRYPGIFGALCAVLIYITLVCEGRLIHRIMTSLPLRALGIVSFSFYLVHMAVIGKLEDMGVALGEELFFLTLVIGYAIACALYGIVERPFLRMGR